MQFLQTVDEMLFFNIDITGSIVAFILVNLASNKPFQEKLRLEIAEQKSQASYNVTEYIGRQDTLLHYVTLESIRVTPAMCKFCVYSQREREGYVDHEDSMADLFRLKTSHPQSAQQHQRSSTVTKSPPTHLS